MRKGRKREDKRRARKKLWRGATEGASGILIGDKEAKI